MRIRDAITIFLCIIAASGFFAASRYQTPAIHQARQQMGLVANAPLENAPPSLAFATVALGAFRGLLVNILWMRADQLKMEGKFFDARQLAEWITTLQPRFAAVWDFHAWNMAYNISVAIPNTRPEERWRWVRNGFELLRDRAIPLNPHSILLYRSLAWIFQHKIGDISDDCHRYYKLQIAQAMRELLGDQPTHMIFEQLATAPLTIEQFLSEPTAAQLVAELAQSDSQFQDTAKLAMHYLSLRSSPSRYDQKAGLVLEKWRDTPALQALDLFSRAFVLRNDWKFDLSFMIELNQKYGPVDPRDSAKTYPLNWEHPAAHAIYWAALGLKKAGRPDQYRIDEKNTDRIVFHSLQMLYRTGRTVLYREPQKETAIFLMPDLRMFDVCDRVWLEIIRKYEEFEGGNPKAVRGGHKNFLENAVVLFYQAGLNAKAEQLYQRLRTEHRYDESGFERTEYQLPLLAFIRTQLKDELQGFGLTDAVEFITAVLRESYLRFALRDDDEAAGRENIAREAYEIYQSQMGQDEPGRVGLPPLDRLRYWSLISFLEDPIYPESLRQSLLARIEIERPDLYKRLQEQEKQVFEELQQMQNQNAPSH